MVASYSGVCARLRRSVWKCSPREGGVWVRSLRKSHRNGESSTCPTPPPAPSPRMHRQRQLRHGLHVSIIQQRIVFVRYFGSRLPYERLFSPFSA